MDDNESIDKSSLYHEPFNVNMYTSAASGCSLNDLQRHHVTPDYTGLLKSISAPNQRQATNKKISFNFMRRHHSFLSIESFVCVFCCFVFHFFRIVIRVLPIIQFKFA